MSTATSPPTTTPPRSSRKGASPKKLGLTPYPRSRGILAMCAAASTCSLFREHTDNAAFSRQSRGTITPNSIDFRPHRNSTTTRTRRATRTHGNATPSERDPPTHASLYGSSHRARHDGVGARVQLSVPAGGRLGRRDLGRSGLGRHRGSSRRLLGTALNGRGLRRLTPTTRRRCSRPATKAGPSEPKSPHQLLLNHD